MDAKTIFTSLKNRNYSELRDQMDIALKTKSMEIIQSRKEEISKNIIATDRT